jgi:hypothetical protein
MVVSPSAAGMEPHFLIVREGRVIICKGAAVGRMAGNLFRLAAIPGPKIGTWGTQFYYSTDLGHAVF